LKDSNKDALNVYMFVCLLFLLNMLYNF